MSDIAPEKFVRPFAAKDDLEPGFCGGLPQYVCCKYGRVARRIIQRRCNTRAEPPEVVVRRNDPLAMRAEKTGDPCCLAAFVGHVIIPYGKGRGRGAGYPVQQCEQYGRVD